MGYGAPPRDPGAWENVIPALDNIGGMHTYSVTAGSLAYPLANLAIFVPFSVTVPTVAKEGWVFSGAAAGGNFDIGIYDDAGARLTSAGSTARGTSAVTNTTTMTDYTLLPNRYYYMGFSADSVNTYFGVNLGVAGMWVARGVLELTTAFALPADASAWVVTTRTFVPNFGLNLSGTAL